MHTRVQCHVLIACACLFLHHPQATGSLCFLQRQILLNMLPSLLAIAFQLNQKTEKKNWNTSLYLQDCKNVVSKCPVPLILKILPWEEHFGG